MQVFQSKLGVKPHQIMCWRSASN